MQLPTLTKHNGHTIFLMSHSSSNSRGSDTCVLYNGYTTTTTCTDKKKKTRARNSADWCREGPHRSSLCRLLHCYTTAAYTRLSITRSPEERWPTIAVNPLTLLQALFYSFDFPFFFLILFHSNAYINFIINQYCRNDERGRLCGWFCSIVGILFRLCYLLLNLYNGDGL